MKQLLEIVGAITASFGLLVGMAGIYYNVVSKTVLQQSLSIDTLILAVLLFGFGVLFMVCAGISPHIDSPREVTMRFPFKTLGAVQAFFGVVIGLLGIGSIAFAVTTFDKYVGLALFIIAILWFGFGILFIGCAAILSELQNKANPPRLERS